VDGFVLRAKHRFDVLVGSVNNLPHRSGCWMVRLKPDTTIVTLVVEKYWRRRERRAERKDSELKK